ncbi:hypothetical protein V8E54_010760 [Elaphomyces granulatus]
MGEMKNLEEAIQTALQAVESTPADHPDRATSIKDQEEALRYLYDAWDCTNAVPFHRVRAAARCLKILATQHKLDAGINLGRAVLELLPAVHTRLLDRNDQQFVISTFAGVARPNEALDQLLDRHTDLSDLLADHSTLARQYERLVNKTTHDAAEVQATKRRREAVARLDACIRTIRGIPDHRRFLLGQTATEMQDEAILISRNTVKSQDSPALPAISVWAEKEKRRVLRIPFLAVAGLYLHAEPANPRPPEGLVDRNRADKLDNAYSRVISSYTPSIKALAHARNWTRNTEEPRAAHSSLLLTIMPTTPSGRSEKNAPKNLPGVMKKKDEIIKAAHDHVTTVILNQPTAEQVLESLKTYSLDPSNSGLILQKSSNGPSEVFEQDRLTAHRINKAVQLSDEVIHVVSGFQVAGFPHVVGCLWPAGDLDCVEVARRFYSSILQRSWSATGNDEVASRNGP